MTKKINKPTTLQGEETKQNEIQKTTNDNVIKAMKDIPEEAKIRIKNFLEKM
jgi:hypothetical protein